MCVCASKESRGPAVEDVGVFRSDQFGGHHHSADEAGPEPVASISGTAADLDAWLWKRNIGWPDDDRIRVEGDRITMEKLETILGQPIN